MSKKTYQLELTEAELELSADALDKIAEWSAEGGSVGASLASRLIYVKMLAFKLRRAMVSQAST